MKKRYRFRNGYRSAKGLVASDVAKELEAIRQRRGLLTAEIVVEEAQKRTSPLHAALEWNTKEAAYQYRLVQARQLIKSIEIVYTERDEEARPQFVITKKENVQQYAPVEVVVGDTDMYEYTMQKVQSLLDAATRTIEQLENMRSLNKQQRIKTKALSKAINTAAQVAGRV